MDFVVVEIETANADLSGICQIGIAAFESGKLIDEHHVKDAPNRGLY